MKLSTDFFLKALHIDPRNIYAANGVGIIWAERGKHADAKEFFTQVREATADIPDIWVNLAHVNMAQGQHVNAIKMVINYYNNNNNNIIIILWCD